MDDIKPEEYPAVIASLHRTCNELQAISDEKDARITELEAIVEKLPKTADGVAVVPGMEVYRYGHSIQEAKSNIPKRIVRGIVDMPLCPVVRTCPAEDGIILGRCASDCYSTRTAAERAAGIHHEPQEQDDDTR